MSKQFFRGLCRHGRGLVFTVTVSSAVAVSHAEIIFEATTENTTAIVNGDRLLPVISGATPDLIVTNPGAGFTSGGFVSTDNINTLNGTPLTVDDTVTISMTIDSITANRLRSNGLEFGMLSGPTHRDVATTDNLILFQFASSSGSDVNIDFSFQDIGTLDFNSNQQAIEDGLTLTLTANSAGYSFFLEDISVRISTNPLFTDDDTTALITGAFAGNEFLDFFSTGHFYVAAQQFNTGALAFDVSSATIDVSDGVVVGPVGDFNGDGNVDCADLDGYVGNIGAAAVGALVELDIDGNGTLEASDADTHITTLVETSNGVVGTFPGDVNCDGQVNVLGDAFALVANLNGPATSYSQGDINFDGQVSVLGDAFALVGNLGMSNE